MVKVDTDRALPDDPPIACGRLFEHHGWAYDRCACGDYRIRHPQGTDACQVCYPRCAGFVWAAADHEPTDDPE